MIDVTHKLQIHSWVILSQLACCKFCETGPRIFFDLVLETQRMMLMTEAPVCQSGFLSSQHSKTLSSYFSPCRVPLNSPCMSMICRRWLQMIFVNPTCFVSVRYTLWVFEKLSPSHQNFNFFTIIIIICVMKFPDNCSYRVNLFNIEFIFLYHIRTHMHCLLCVLFSSY